jgi:hypothetical protein
MFEQATDNAAPGFGYAAATPPPPPLPAATYELRPLSTGEILDRTFSLYRRRFWLYCGLSALSATVGTLTALAQMIWMKTPAAAQAGPASAAATAAVLKATMIGGLVGMLVGMIHFIAYSVTQAATVSAVSSVYLGHETSMGTALKAVRGKWWRYAGIALWQIWSGFWIFFVLIIPAVMLVALKIDGLAVIGGLLMIVAFGSLIYGIIAYIRNSLGIAASVFERIPVRAAMRRSKNLVEGHKGRIFLLLVLLYVLSLVAGGLQIPFVVILMKSHTGQKILLQGMSLALAFVTNSLIGPIGAIAFCLFYFDARVRKEGFDIEALMDPTLGSAFRPVPVPEPPPLLPSGFAPSGFTASPFPPSGLTAPSPFPPSGLTPQAQDSSPFAPSGFTAPTAETPKTTNTEPE